jgi:mobilization protein NikA
MPEPAQVASQKTVASFAKLLTSFTGRLQSDPWDDSTLADDVAVLTYEQALRSTRRARLPEAGMSAMLQAALPSDRQSGASVHRPENSGSEKKCRTASITVRVTAEEQAQLHERATAAGLSVSAYLRSCIFEAEALRSQVKDALAQMQTVQPVLKRSTPNGPRPGWRKLLLSTWLRSRTVENDLG